MLKKMNVAVLTVLLLFQTVLNPISTFAAEGDPPAPTAEEVSGVTLTQFDMKIGGNAVTLGEAYNTPLPQNQTAQFDVAFDVMLDKVYGAGSYFEFQLPDSLIDFDGAFNGQKTVDGITYNYTTTGSKVKVELVNDVLPEQVSDTTPAQMTMSFTAGFTLMSDALQQDLELPKANSGTDTITTSFTFLPSTTNEKVSKAATGIPVSVGGNHQMEWIVWVNKAGKDFVSSTLTDSPTGGHAIVANSVDMYEYEVGLNGVKAATETQVLTGGNWANIVSKFQDKKAYKIVYKTEVNLPVANREGSKTFTNKITLTNNGVPEESTATKTITYGKAIDKVLKDGTNYKSTWEIRFNYNEASILAADAVITDTISSSDTHQHLIDTSSIEVYEVEIVDGQQKSGGTETLVDASNYTISDVVGTATEASSFKLKFNNNVTKAYKIVYDANYVTQDFYDGDGTTITNVATYGTKSDDATHSLSNDLLSKSRTVNFATKEITWTINIRNDHPTQSITGLTLNDQFEMAGKTGEHTLVGNNNDITITNAGTPTKVVDADNKGFEITNIDITPKTSATVTYKTSFTITEEGAVVVDGYGNTATTTWTSGKPYTETRTAHYTPEATTVNNGTKSGKVNYTNQQFTWEVRVNINKKDIQGAILTDQIGAGHEFEDGSLKVYKLTLGVGDEVGTYNPSDELADSNYILDVDADKKGYTLTFNDPVDEAYVVVYNTKDSDNIFGIGSDETGYTLGNRYTNVAKFKTKGTQEFTLDSTPVNIQADVANSLIKKGVPNQNSSTQKVTWALDVNKSHSNLGETVVEDIPSANLMLIPDSIKLRPYVVSATGVSTGGSWKTPAQLKADGILTKDVEITAAGGFKLTFANLKLGYQVQYETIGLGQQGDTFSNNATISFAGTTADNQEKSSSTSNAFSFSSSDSSFSMTKGSAQFKKIGVNSSTAVSEALQGVQFQLIKKIGSTEYIIRTATSDANGLFSFNDISYGNYAIKEVGAPAGYMLMPNKAFKLESANDAKLAPTVVTTLVNTTALDANACTKFDLTIYDIDGDAVASKQVKLYDSNGAVVFTGNTDANGKIEIPSSVSAGNYTVKDTDDSVLGEVTVKYGENECQGEIKPTNACPAYTITLNEKDSENNNVPRANVAVTLKDGSGNTVATGTTDSNGKFTISSTTPGGKYYVYENKQFLGEVIVTYKANNCESTLVQAPSCPVFTVTVRDMDGNTRSGVNVVIKDKQTSTEVTTKTTDADGKVTIINLDAGIYELYESTGGVETKLGEFTTNTDCEAEVQPAPACPAFTITVKDADGNVKKQVKVTVKDKDGNNVVTNVETDNAGKFVLPNTTKAGKYTIYQGELYVGEITVSYLTDCQTSIAAAPSCPAFTLTIQNSAGIARKDVEITIKDAANNVVKVNNGTEDVSIFKTDENGQIILSPGIIKEGTYNVYEGSYVLGTLKVVDVCSAVIKPYAGGGGYIPPVVSQPEKPEPEKPSTTDPEKPKPIDPEKPDTTDPEQPDKTTPEKPAPAPGTVTPKPNPKPGNSVQAAGSNSNATSGGLNANTEKLAKKLKNKVQGYPAVLPSEDDLQGMLELYEQYLKMSSYEKRALEKLIDIEKIKAILLAEGIKLPQTDSSANKGMMSLGLLLMVMSVMLFMRQRKTN